MDTYFFQGHKHDMKYKQLHTGIEHGSTSPFATTIEGATRASNVSENVMKRNPNYTTLQKPLNDNDNPVKKKKKD